jgi:hypothetical protein
LAKWKCHQKREKWENTKEKHSKIQDDIVEKLDNGLSEKYLNDWEPIYSL